MDMESFVSDPRAQVLKGFVEKLAKEKGRMKDYQLYANVEHLAPEVIAQERRIYKGVSANVDFYSGFVYSMLDLPLELYTYVCCGTYCRMECAPYGRAVAHRAVSVTLFIKHFIYKSQSLF